MSYGADFATADPANAPLDAPLVIGADPMLWGALAIGLVAAFLIGWALGARSRAGKGDAAQAIWQAIEDAAKDAMKADDDHLKGRAQTLLKVLMARLGKTLILTQELSGRVGGLQDAVDGKGKGKADGHGHGHAPGPGHDPHKPGGGHDPHPTPGPVVTYNIGVLPPQAPDHGHAPCADAETRDLTTREQTDALRLAVAGFNEHWRHEAERVAEMRAAREELGAVTGAPRSPKLSSSRASH